LFGLGFCAVFEENVRDFILSTLQAALPPFAADFDYVEHGSEGWV